VPDEQDQFLDVVDRDTAAQRWWDALRPRPARRRKPSRSPPPSDVCWRKTFMPTLTCRPSTAPTSTATPFAPEDTYGASEEAPRSLRLNPETIPTGVVPRVAVERGTATPIQPAGCCRAGPTPSSWSSKHSWKFTLSSSASRSRRGAGVSFAGTDVAKGELVLRAGTRLTARETGVLAAIGRAEVPVVRRPRVAVLSTGDEILAPGEPSRPAAVYDANATLLADAVRELGGEPVPLGIVPDDDEALEAALDRALAYDVVLLSGGTSKGAGDRSYRVLARQSPGVVVHGVRAQARQAGLPRGRRLCRGGYPAGLPHVGNVHVSRIRRPTYSLPRRRSGRAARDAAGDDAGALQ